MHPHLWDSMQFLYMKDDVSYEEFLAAVYEAENEGTEGKVVNMKAKAKTVEKVIEEREKICRSWFSLEQNCWFIEDKLSSTAVESIRSEGIAERQHPI